MLNLLSVVGDHNEQLGSLGNNFLLGQTTSATWKKNGDFSSDFLISNYFSIQNFISILGSW